MQRLAGHAGDWPLFHHMCGDKGGPADYLAESGYVMSPGVALIFNHHEVERSGKEFCTIVCPQ